MKDAPAIPVLVAAGATHVGAVRTTNEDAHVADADAGIAIVCDGMGGHLAGEIASALAVELVHGRWAGPELARARAAWLRGGTPALRRALIGAVRGAVVDANQTIIDRSTQDRGVHGMGTTFTGALFVAGDAVFAHAGDSRAYRVRDGAALRLTEDHTLLARLAEAGVDVEAEGEVSRWKGVVTNALGIGEATRVASFTVPLADGDRFLLCSDGVSEYLDEPELAGILTSIASPARAAQKIVDLAVERGGHDNATAVVVKVVEAGGPDRPPAARRADDEAIARCPLVAAMTPQRRLRALRIAVEHDVAAGEPLPARYLGDPAAWILVAGRAVRDRGGGKVDGAEPGALLYPEVLVASGPPPPPPAEWRTDGPARALVVRAADLADLAQDEPDLGEALYGALATIARR